MKHVAVVIRSISVAVLFVLSTTVLPFPAAFADPQPGCTRTCGLIYCMDWSDGSWICVSKTYCCGNGTILTCDFDWGCDPNAATCGAQDAIFSGQIDPCSNM